MAFWSSQTLRDKLPALIIPYDNARVDQSSYTLTIGSQIFITKDYRNNNSQHTKQSLKKNQPFVIPPGQFAYLLTEEEIQVPIDAIAFISMKASLKYKGLINISGFHVDPGFKGNLLFSVYNAGPSPINLQRNQECFLIWYSSLDFPDASPRTGTGFSDIPIKILDNISTDEIYSLQTLTKEFREVESRVSDQLNNIKSINRQINATKIIVWSIVVAIITIVAFISSSFVSIGKFAIEQREIIGNISEYKEMLDDLIKQKHKNDLKEAPLCQSSKPTSLKISCSR
jgi:dCTP deaminase